MQHKLLGLVVAALLVGFNSGAQGISGFVLDERNNPVPFANIFVKELQTGTSTDVEGKYFLSIPNGFYEVVISSVGFQTLVTSVKVGDAMKIINYRLKSSSKELEEVVIKAKRKNPAYEIIQKVIDQKSEQLKAVDAYRASVYIKATEEIVNHTKESTPPVTISTNGLPADPTLQDEIKDTKPELPNISLAEIEQTLNYQYPDNYKAIRSGYKKVGTQAGLYIPNFQNADFNVYHNLIDLKGIAEAPVISPLSRTAILSYKYELEDISIDSAGLMNYIISFKPRKAGNSTCEGQLTILDKYWKVLKADLSLSKSGLKIYDKFDLSLQYKILKDSVWMPYRHQFQYQIKQGRKKTFKGNTVVFTKDYELDPVFEPKFFDHAVSITTKEAYERDSSYWNGTRPEPLTMEESKVVMYEDSVKRVHSSKEYIDSMEAKFNKITMGEVLYDGIGYRNHDKQTRYYFPSLLSLVNFEVIGGFRLGPYVSQFKRWESGRILANNINSTIGMTNGDVNGSINTFFRYDPFMLADIRVSAGHTFYSVNSNDAYLNQLRISNYILHDYFSLYHRFEILNGLYLTTEAIYSNRQSVNNLDATSVLNEVIEETDPLQFETYQGFNTYVQIGYTPAQKYVIEPNGKYVLGSKYPTFEVGYKKAIRGVAGSDTKFEYIDFTISQNLILGIFGNSKYTAKTGLFTNTESLPFIDLVRFRQSDPYLYSDPRSTFQLLDTSLVAKDLFIDVHLIHHFNGALINNLPFIKKTGIRAVAGAGALWVKENGYRHEELFAGLERVFKLGARRRLRIGLFGVLAESNKTGINTGWKISFDIIDTWKREWSY